MSLCLCRVCMRAALIEAAPGALVYSAILSFTPVSFKKNIYFNYFLLESLILQTLQLQFGIL